MVEPGAATKFQRFLSLQVLYPNFRSGVSSSVYLGATRGRAWVRLGRIKSPTKKRFQVFKKTTSTTDPVFIKINAEHERFFRTPASLTSSYLIIHKNLNLSRLKWPTLLIRVVVTSPNYHKH